VVWELLEQELIVVLRDAEEGETLVELQSTFRPTAESLEFAKTNFGFLAVRVAQSLSNHFGGGVLTNSEGAVGEKEIFGLPARWVDYSGPIVQWQHEKASTHTEGITYFDHPANPRYPTAWHVRSDRWMGAAPCLQEGLVTHRQQPLQLRYLLHAHRGGIDAGRAQSVAEAFARRPPYQVQRSSEPHRMYRVSPLS
jgi:hypothetical protein